MFRSSFSLSSLSSPYEFFKSVKNYSFNTQLLLTTLLNFSTSATSASVNCMPMKLWNMFMSFDCSTFTIGNTTFSDQNHPSLYLIRPIRTSEPTTVGLHLDLQPLKSSLFLVSSSPSPAQIYDHSDMKYTLHLESTALCFASCRPC